MGNVKEYTHKKNSDEVDKNLITKESPFRCSKLKLAILLKIPFYVNIIVIVIVQYDWRFVCLFGKRDTQNHRF